MTYWTAGQRITGERLENFVQRGTELVTFTSQTSRVITVTFPTPFAAAPIITTNIASGSGVTARWGSRAITITANDFQLFLFVGDSGAGAVSWSDVPVQWVAVAL